MKRAVTVTLTRAEASALLHAVGNSIYDGADVDVLVNPQTRAACWRGHDKIKAALRGES